VIKKIVMVALVVVLGMAAFPASNVSAAGMADETTPPERTEKSGERLEKAWERTLKMNQRVGRIFDRVDTVTEKIQILIERANEKGMDTANVQVALDAFTASVDEAFPIYERAQDLIKKYSGFDANGKVTVPEKALETLKSLKESYAEIREITGMKGKALRDAIKAFREENPRQERPSGEKPDFAPSH